MFTGKQSSSLVIVVGLLIALIMSLAYLSHNSVATALWDKASPDADEIVPHIYLGNFGSGNNEAWLRQHNIVAIVNVRFKDDKVYPGIVYLHIPVHDHANTMISDYFAQANTFIDEQLRKIGVIVRDICSGAPFSTSGEPAILIHCDYGKSRSPTILAAYLMHACGYTADEALAQIRKVRTVKPRSNFMDQLRAISPNGVVDRL